MIIKIVLFLMILSSYFFINKGIFIYVFILSIVLYEIYNKFHYRKKYSILRKIIEAPSLEDIELDYKSKEVRRIGESMIALISQLKIREQKLLYDSEYIEKLLEMLDGVLITLSESGYIVAVNKFFLRVLKIEEEAIIGKAAKEIAYIDEIGEYIKKHPNDKEGELEINDRIFDFKYRTLSGNLKDKIVFIRDITKSRDLERIRVEMQKREALKDFAYGVTHEIRNPLTPIKGLIQILKEELSQNDKSSKYMDMVFKEIDRLDKKIDKLDRFIEDDKDHKEEVIMDEFIKSVVDDFKENEFYHHKNADISFQGCLGDIKLEIDIMKLKEAFDNILKNSYESIENNGVIIVKTYEREGRKIIKISDNGRGMSEETLRRMRNPLYTTKISEKAMGMGLPIACKIINNHGANVEFNSEYNKGTDIRIIFT